MKSRFEHIDILGYKSALCARTGWGQGDAQGGLLGTLLARLSPGPAHDTD